MNFDLFCRFEFKKLLNRVFKKLKGDDCRKNSQYLQ